MKNKEKSECNCNEDLNDKKSCNCDETCTCGCQDGKCTCDENCSCGCNGNKEESKCEEKKDYLDDLLRLQAEFDNYRKRMINSLGEARKDGFIEAITEFLPALDSFKMATDMITDKNTLIGIKFIEKGILDTLKKMGVEEIDTTGKFDPNLHHAIESEDQGLEQGTIIKECYKGFTYNGKVVRYSQVIVQK